MILDTMSKMEMLPIPGTENVDEHSSYKVRISPSWQTLE